MFLEELDRLGVLDDSIVMITSDHGEEFGDHGGRTHGYNLYEEQLRVPLVFLRTPAFPYNKTVSEPVGLVDVMPTLIAHLELESPDRLSHGASFSDLFHSDARRNAPEYQYAETRLGIPFKSVTYQNRWKFIYSQQEDSRGEWLFDLSQDEFEKVNLLKDRPIIASKLREKLDETFAGYKNDALASETFEPDEKTRQMLHSLGYIQ